MRWTATSLLLVLTWAALAGCAGISTTSASGGPASVAPSTTVVAAPPSPGPTSAIEGTWRSRKVTEPEFIRWYKGAGGTAEDPNGTRYKSVTAAAKAFWGSSGVGTAKAGGRYQVFTIRFQSGHFALFINVDGGAAELGDTATYTVSGRKLTLVDSNPQFPCTGTYTFAVTGRRLAAARPPAMLRLRVPGNHAVRELPVHEGAVGARANRTLAGRPRPRAGRMCRQR